LSGEVADRLIEALWRVHAEDCEVGSVVVSRTFEGHEVLRELWNVFADEDGHAAPEWTTSGTSEGDQVSYNGVSILEIESKVRRFMACFDSRKLGSQVVK
jgi:hypothetical protein